MDSRLGVDLHYRELMIQPSPSPVVHLELHTGNLARACDFYARLYGWRVEEVEAGHISYHALDWGGGLGGGIVECGTNRASWLPYLEVSRIDEATEHARRFGASVLLDPREGPAGWRSVVEVPEGAEIALWQSKTPAARSSVPESR
jgi:predicted enzyme related to lactoylglutathione lyase